VQHEERLAYLIGATAKAAAAAVRAVARAQVATADAAPVPSGEIGVLERSRRPRTR
jgi:hypothetical protein